MSWGAAGATWPAVAGGIYRYHLEEIRQAINERASASNTSVSSMGSAWTAGQIARPIMSSIQTAMSLLMVEFVKYTHNGGDWTDDGITVTDIAPEWVSAAQFMADLGESRLAVPAVGYTLPAWINQQYRILNEMRWTRRGLTISNSERRDGTGASLAAATTDWNGNAWFSSTLGIPDRSAAHYMVCGRTYSLFRKRSDIAVSGIWTGASHSYQLYGRFYGPPTSDGLDWYSNHDYGLGFSLQAEGYAENAVIDAGGPAATASYSWSVGDIGTVTLGAGDDPGRGRSGWTLYNPDTFVVLKWDVTGGFTFIA